jgi:hypothetical protein
MGLTKRHEQGSSLDGTWTRTRTPVCLVAQPGLVVHTQRLRGIRLLDNGVVEEEEALRTLSPLGVGVQMGTVLVQEGTTAGE